MTPADHRPSLQMPGGRGKHEPELNREEHPLQSSSPSSLNFCCALFALLCRGDLSRFPFAHLDTDLLLYSSRLNTQRKGSGLCHPSILFLYISFSSPGVLLILFQSSFLSVFFSLLCRLQTGSSPSHHHLSSSGSMCSAG